MKKRVFCGNYLVDENIHDAELKDKTNSDAEEEVGETKQDSAIRSP